MEHIRDGLLRNVDCNVILVDWYRGGFPPYVQAAGNTRLVGAIIAELIKFLISQTQSSPDLYHIVGFSLGSHIAGYAGSRLQQDGIILGRVTGNCHSWSAFEFRLESNVIFNRLIICFYVYMPKHSLIN